MHVNEKPKKKGTPGITHTTQNALFRWNILVTALLGNILPTQSLNTPESSGISLISVGDEKEEIATLRLTNRSGAREVKLGNFGLCAPPKDPAAARLRPGVAFGQSTNRNSGQSLATVEEPMKKSCPGSSG